MIAWHNFAVNVYIANKNHNNIVQYYDRLIEKEIFTLFAQMICAFFHNKVTQEGCRSYHPSFY